jgi:hypothetical protein
MKRIALPLLACLLLLPLSGCCNSGKCNQGACGAGTGVTPCVPQFVEGGHGWR